MYVTLGNTENAVASNNYWAFVFAVRGDVFIICQMVFTASSSSSLYYVSDDSKNLIQMAAALTENPNSIYVVYKSKYFTITKQMF